jgi:hypothetical protein
VCVCVRKCQVTISPWSKSRANCSPLSHGKPPVVCPPTISTHTFVFVLPSRYCPDSTCLSVSTWFTGRRMVTGEIRWVLATTSVLGTSSELGQSSTIISREERRGKELTCQESKSL